MSKKITNGVLATALKITVAFGLCNHAYAAQIATDPGDYTALPAGTNLALAYGQSVQRDRLYSNRTSAGGPFVLDTDIGLIRYVHFMKIGEYVIDPQIILPFGSVKLKQPVSLRASGVGDPLLGGTFWVVNEPQQSKYLGLSAFLSVPIGSYEGRRGSVNVGENRWKAIFQAGHIMPVGEKWLLDLIGEVTYFGDNDNFAGARREQDVQYGAQTHLRYLLDQGSHLALSYYHDFGAQSTVGGIRQNDRLNNSNLQLTYAKFFTPKLQVQLQYGQGLRTKNGPQEDQRINVRILTVF